MLGEEVVIGLGSSVIASSPTKGLDVGSDDTSSQTVARNVDDFDGDDSRTTYGYLSVCDGGCGSQMPAHGGERTEEVEGGTKTSEWGEHVGEEVSVARLQN